MIATYIVMRPSGVDDQHKVIWTDFDRQDATRVKPSTLNGASVTWCPYCDNSNQNSFAKCGGCGNSIEYKYEEGDIEYSLEQQALQLAVSEQLEHDRLQAESEEAADTVVAGDLTVDEIEGLIPSWDFEKLLTMQNQEENGKQRVGALELLFKAVTDAGGQESDDD